MRNLQIFMLGVVDDRIWTKSCSVVVVCKISGPRDWSFSNRASRLVLNFSVPKLRGLGFVGLIRGRRRISIILDQCQLQNPSRVLSLTETALFMIGLREKTSRHAQSYPNGTLKVGIMRMIQCTVVDMAVAAASLVQEDIHEFAFTGPIGNDIHSLHLPVAMVAMIEWWWWSSRRHGGGKLVPTIRFGLAHVASREKLNIHQASSNTTLQLIHQVANFRPFWHHGNGGG
jgi:hypothetical protein